MKILFVTRLFPHFTVRTSGTQDQVRYIEALRQNHDVSLISFVSAGQEAAVEEMKRICSSVICVPYDHYALLPRLWRAMWRVLLPEVKNRCVVEVFGLTPRGDAAGISAGSQPRGADSFRQVHTSKNNPRIRPERGNEHTQ